MLRSFSLSQLNRSIHSLIAAYLLACLPALSFSWPLVAGKSIKLESMNEVLISYRLRQTTTIIAEHLVLFLTIERLLEERVMYCFLWTGNMILGIGSSVRGY